MCVQICILIVRSVLFGGFPGCPCHARGHPLVSAVALGLRGHSLGAVDSLGGSVTVDSLQLWDRVVCGPGCLAAFPQGSYLFRKGQVVKFSPYIFLIDLLLFQIGVC